MAVLQNGQGPTDQAKTQVHQTATQATGVLNKLAQLLSQAGAPEDVVRDIDNMSNAVNEIASAAVGNLPEEQLPAEAEPVSNPPRSDLEGAVQDFHSEQVAAAGGAAPIY